MAESKNYDWAAMCEEAEKNETPIAYEFSNGRKFESPEDSGGVYQQGTE